MLKDALKMAWQPKQFNAAVVRSVIHLIPSFSIEVATYAYCTELRASFERCANGAIVRIVGLTLV